jgi:hypothetical protein
MKSEVAAAIEDADIGPAMRALNDRQRAFVRAVITLGSGGIQNNAKAAEIAGYSGSTRGVLKDTGWRLANDARIQAALLEEARRTVNVAAAVVATPVVISIAMDKSVKPQDRLRAAEMLFNRGGMPALTEQKITVEHGPSNERMEMLARKLADELGIDPARLVGVNRSASAAIEAEYTEVTGDKA